MMMIMMMMMMMNDDDSETKIVLKLFQTTRSAILFENQRKKFKLFLMHEFNIKAKQEQNKKCLVATA